MQERLTAEHAGELLGDALEHLLDGRAVPEERNRHLEALGRDIANLPRKHNRGHKTYPANLPRYENKNSTATQNYETQ